MARKLAIFIAILSWTCCSAVLYSPRNTEIKKDMAQAESFARRGLYREAISGYEQINRKSPENPWQDEVLYSLGRLYALDENPGKDFFRSLFYFQGLKEKFPRSPRSAQIQVWIGLLEKIVSLELKMAEREAEFAELKLSLEGDIERLKAERLAEINLRVQKLRELEDLIQIQQNQIGALQQQLKRMKEIDIKSEKKAAAIK